MNNKNGFTFVEIIASVGIISMILLLIIPAVVRKFNEARREAFITEVRSIYKSALNQYSYDQVKHGNVIIYCYNPKDSVNRNEIDLINGNENIAYYVKVDNGVITDNLYYNLKNDYTFNAVVDNATRITDEDIISSNNNFSCADYLS